MTFDELDSLLAYLYAKGAKRVTHTDIIKEHFKGNESADPLGMFIKLDKDGYVDKGYVDYSEKEQERNGGVIRDTTYKLSFDGRLNFEDAPFIFQHRPYKWKQIKARANEIWTVLKITMIILNAVAILILTYLQIKK